MQQKKVGWEVSFSELGFAGSGARKPRREFEGSALEPFFHVFLRLNGVFIVYLNYHIKASVKLIEFVRENQIIPWQGVYFFTNTVYSYPSKSHLAHDGCGKLNEKVQKPLTSWLCKHLQSIFVTCSVG